MIEKFRSRFLEAWEASDRIFDLVPRTAWLEQPILLRHPILFYVGHLPAFAWNQVGRGVLGLDHFLAGDHADAGHEFRPAWRRLAGGACRQQRQA